MGTRHSHLIVFLKNAMSELSSDEAAPTPIAEGSKEGDDGSGPETKGVGAGKGESSPTAKREVKFSVGDVLGDMTPNYEKQPSLMAPVKPINLRIYTEDDQFESMQFQTGRYTTAGEIVSAMFARLGLPEETKDVFSVWLMSPYLQLQLKSYHIPVKLFKKWHEFLSQYTTATYEVCKTDQPVLYFRRNAFFSIREEKRLIVKKNSRKTISLLYYEAVRNVVSGRYPLKREELIDLAAIQCAVENQGFDEKVHTESYFKDNLKTYFPSHMLPAAGGMKAKLLGGASKAAGLEAPLIEAYQKIWKKVSESSSKRMENPVDVETSAVAAFLGPDEEKKLWQDIDLQLKLLYLQRCWIKPYYGCVMFRGQVERKANIKYLLTYSDRNVIIAINPESIHLFTDTNPREILLYLTYDLFNWDFQPATEEGEKFFSSLWLEFDSTQGSQKVAKRLQIFSRQAPMMDAMITRCVDELNKHDEEMQKLRGTENAPVHSITTGVTLPSAKNFKEDKLKCDVYKPDPGAAGATNEGSPTKKRSSRDDTTKPEESTMLQSQPT